MDIEATARGCLSRETLQRLSRRSNSQGLLQLGLHVGGLCITGLLVWMSRGQAWLIGAVVLHGIALSFLFCALHESIHRTAFASRWLSDLVAGICGALLMLPPAYFRAFHFAHHRFTQDPTRDPELAVAAPVTLAAYLWRVSGIPYWRDRLTVTASHALTGHVQESFVSAQKSAAIVLEARVLWAGYLCVLAASVYWRRADALVYWVLPAVVGQPFLRLFLLAEHWGCPLSSDMLENTRTTHTNLVVRRLTWLMPYHAEHHACPSVPFHTLPALHALIGSRVRVTAPGYLAVHRELLQQLRSRGAK
ncbi:MAG TPA: fatty acid desaturase [Steroidobacteraceae bacterium]|jgi:fatty acid desaturase